MGSAASRPGTLSGSRAAGRSSGTGKQQQSQPTFVNSREEATGAAAYATALHMTPRDPREEQLGIRRKDVRLAVEEVLSGRMAVRQQQGVASSAGASPSGGSPNFSPAARAQVPVSVSSNVKPVELERRDSGETSQGVGGSGGGSSSAIAQLESALRKAGLREDEAMQLLHDFSSQLFQKHGAENSRSRLGDQSGPLTPPPSTVGGSPSVTPTTSTSFSPVHKRTSTAGVGSCPVPHQLRNGPGGSSPSAGGSPSVSPALSRESSQHQQLGVAMANASGSGTSSPANMSRRIAIGPTGCPIVSYLKPTVLSAGNKGTCKGMDDWVQWYEAEGKQLLGHSEGAGSRENSGRLSLLGGDFSANGNSGSFPAVSGNMEEFMMAVIVKAHQLFFWDETPNGARVCNFLLGALLTLSASPVGLIASVVYKKDGTPYVKSHAISNVGWNQQIIDWYNANVDDGLVFANMDSLLGASIHSGAPEMSNDYKSDPRKSGTPPGHPTVHCFASVPLFMGSQLLGVWMTINRAGGYDEALISALEPLNATIAQVLFGIAARKRRRESDQQLFTSCKKVNAEALLVVNSLGVVTAASDPSQALMEIKLQPVAGSGLESGASGGAVAVVGGVEVRPLAEPVAFQDLFFSINSREDFMLLGMDTHLEHSYWAMGRGPRSKTTLLKVQLSRKLAPKGAYFVASVTPLNYEEDLEQAMRVSGFQ